MHILFIHGRAQEEFTQETLLKKWQEGLRTSFKNADIPFPDELVLHLPYYGKDLMHQRDLYKEDIKNGKFKMRSSNQVNELDKCKDQLLEDILINAGISKKQLLAEMQEQQQYRGLRNNKYLIAFARYLDRWSAGAGNFGVKWQTDDVATYLAVGDARNEINNIYNLALTEKPTIIIAHSLGTVIAYDVLHSLTNKSYNIKGLITLGSPLGMNAIKRQLYPNHSYPPTLKGPWLNIYDPKDIVALNPLDDKNFKVTPKIINQEIENESDNRHNIAPYLSCPLVAQMISELIKKSNKE